jgi:hypothetical protein
MRYLLFKMKNQAKTTPYEKPVLIIKSHVKDWINQRGFRMNDFTTRAINDAVIELLEKSIIRCKLSKMKTINSKHV